MERSDFSHWSATEVARLLALLEAQLRYYREIAAALPIPAAVVSKDRAILWSNKAFRQRLGTKVPDRAGFTEIPVQAWHDEDETETLLVLEPLPQASIVSSGVPVDLPAIVWQADATTLAFRSVEGDAEATMGYPASYWLNHREFFEERIHPDDRASTMALYRSVIETGGEASAEYRTASGSVWCRETIRIAGTTIAGVITDITARKSMERQLLSAGRFEALYGFAGRLAHDLNNPLMIVTGYAEELMQALKPSDPLRQDASEILGAARRIGGIAAQLTEFARRQGKPATRVNIGEAISKLRSRLAAEAGEGVTVELQGHPEPVVAMADEGQLGEVLAAVVAGTRRGAPRKRARVVIAWDVQTVTERLSPTALAAGHYARITISADGDGLDAEQAANVFDPVLSKTSDPAAAALALPRAYSLVHEWAGDIALATEPGRGSTFAIYLPHVETEGAPDRIPATRTEPQRGEPARILVVDDETGIRELIRKILQRERYRVLEAGTAEEALSIAQRQSIDLLITDVLLPGIHGPELARRMQQAAPRIKTLFISGFTGEEEVPSGGRFLAKPFTLGTLLQKVREALE
jgi:two-component system, cell cycle sensor histidine kinase and response regulator CckA